MPVDIAAELETGRNIIKGYRTNIESGHPERDFRWEPFADEFIKQAKTARVLVDAGAEFGFYAYLALKHMPRDGFVYCIEPDPVRRMLLQELFSERGNVAILPFAVAGCAGEVELTRPAGGQSPTLDAGISQCSSKDAETITVPAAALDDLFDGIRIDILKMDIEGAEALAFPGMRRILERRATTIFIETHPKYVEAICPGGLQKIDSMLTSAGYTVLNEKGHVRSLGGRAILSPIGDTLTIDRLLTESGYSVLDADGEPADLSGIRLGRIHQPGRPLPPRQLLSVISPPSPDLRDGLLIENLVTSRLRELSHRYGRVALYGAGKHTCWLLGLMRTAAQGEDEMPQVVNVMDDRGGECQPVWGHAVIKPQQLAAGHADAVILSSDCHQLSMRLNLDRSLNDPDIPVIDLYEGMPPGPFVKRASRPETPPGQLQQVA